MLLAMNRRLRRTEAFLAVAFAAALVIGPDLAEAQDAGGAPPATPPAATDAPPSPTPAAPQSPTPPPAATEAPATPAPPPAAAEAPATPAPQAEQPPPEADRFSQDELRKLLAPIALYPDALLAQMLPAAAYPLEIVQAHAGRTRIRILWPPRTFPGSTIRSGTPRSRRWRGSPMSFAR